MDPLNDKVEGVSEFVKRASLHGVGPSGLNDWGRDSVCADRPVIPVSVLILTRNEEQDLPGCIRSLGWTDDVHVFDSFSEDRTVAIAQSMGAKLTQRAFDGYASQRNAALETVQFKYEWVLILDADERVRAPLVQEIAIAVKSVEDTVGAFRIQRRDFFQGVWLKYAQISPFFSRLVRPKMCRYEREVNEVLRVNGEIRTLSGSFDHFPFSKGIAHWIQKHNVYSSMEASRLLEERDAGIVFSWKRALMAPDFSERRYNQKGLFYKLPARPIIKFVYMIFWRRAFLDGRAGVIYAVLQCIYEYFIVLKVKEREDVRRSE